MTASQRFFFPNIKSQTWLGKVQVQGLETLGLVLVQTLGVNLGNVGLQVDVGLKSIRPLGFGAVPFFAEVVALLEVLFQVFIVAVNGGLHLTSCCIFMVCFMVDSLGIN